MSREIEIPVLWAEAKRQEKGRRFPTTAIVRGGRGLCHSHWPLLVLPFPGALLPEKMVIISMSSEL